MAPSRSSSAATNKRESESSGATGGSRGGGALPPRRFFFFFKIIQFSGNFNGKPPILSKFWAQGLALLGQNSAGPLTKILDPPLEAQGTSRPFPSMSLVWLFCVEINIACQFLFNFLAALPAEEERPFMSHVVLFVVVVRFHPKSGKTKLMNWRLHGVKSS